MFIRIQQTDICLELKNFKKDHDNLNSNTQKHTHLQGTQSPTQSQPCKRVCFLPTLPGHTLLIWTQTVISTHQDEGRTYNIGFGKIRADTCKLQHL